MSQQIGIDPSARVAAGAIISESASVGPFCVICLICG